MKPSSGRPADASSERAERRRLVGEIAFSALVVALGAVAVWGSRGWPIGARLFPTLFGLLVGVVAFGNGVAAFVAHQRRSSEDDLPAEASTTVEPGEDDAETLSGVFAFLWILAFPVAGAVLGFVAAVPLVTFLFSRFAAKESWLSAIVLALVMSGLVWFVGSVMGVRLPAGVLGG